MNDNTNLTAIQVLPTSAEEINALFEPNLPCFSSKDCLEFNKKLLAEFFVFCNKGNDLFKSVYGDKWFSEAPLFRWFEQDKSRGLSPIGRSNKGFLTASAWQVGKSLTGLQIAETVAKGQNLYWKADLKKALPAYISFLNADWIVIDVDWHDETKYDQRPDFRKFINSLDCQYLYEPTSRGEHYYLRNSRALGKDDDAALSAKDSQGNSLECELLTGIWDAENQQFRNSKQVILGAGRGIADYSNRVYYKPGIPEFPVELIPVKGSKTAKKTEAGRNTSIYCKLCGKAPYLPATPDGESQLCEIALQLWEALEDKSNFSQEEALSCAKSAAKYLGSRYSEKAEKQPKIDPLLLCVQKLKESPNAEFFYFNERADCVYTLKNGLLEEMAVEDVPELVLPEGYSRGQKYRLYSLLKTYLPADRRVNSLWELTEESTCLFKDGTVLSLKDGQPSISKSSEAKKPFANAINADFSLTLANEGFNQNFSILQQEAPNFSYYLNSSLDKEESRRRICMMIGQALTPRANLASICPNIYNLIANTGTGKGTIIKFLVNVIGREAVAVLRSMPNEKNRWALSEIVKRKKAPALLLTPDNSVKDVADPNVFKNIAGGDGLTVETKGVDGRDTLQNLTWIISSNSKLKFSAEWNGLSQKIGEIPFQTTKDLRNDIAANIPDLDSRLTEEASAILSFCWGLLIRQIWEKRPFDYSFTQKYLTAETENSELLQFLTLRCSYDADEKSSYNDIFAAFKSFAEIESMPIGEYFDALGGFNKRFRQRVQSWFDRENIKTNGLKRNGGKTERCYPVGISRDDTPQEITDIPIQPVEPLNLWDVGLLSQGLLDDPTIQEAILEIAD